MSDILSFFVVTPCYNGMPWLPACIASVAAQAGPNIRVHHHVQDGGSTDGSREFLEKICGNDGSSYDKTTADKSSLMVDGGMQGLNNYNSAAYQLTFASESDEGMYDAINKGWDRADKSIDWLGHLNADEQYQPGVFERIVLEGKKHPNWGAITGNCIWVDGQGEYLCSRKPSVGWPWVGRIWIPAFTCALFIRREFYGAGAVRLDTSWKSFGDKVFCRDLLNACCRFGYVDEYMAIFVHRGDENLGFQPITEVERKRYWLESLKPTERFFSKVSILVARISRVLRCRFGKTCKSYIWITESRESLSINVKQHHWNITG